MTTLWRPSEVQTYLACSASTLSRLIACEGLPYVPMQGRGRRFDPASVRAWKEGRERARAGGRRERPQRAAWSCWDGVDRLGVVR